VFFVSAASHQGFDPLLDEVARELEDLPPILHFQEEEEPEDETHSYDEYAIEKDGPVYVVTGYGAELILESVNNALANPLQVTQSQYTEAPAQ
jgi:GTP-binding protein